MLSKEAGGARYEFSLLLMHAEDQMMTAETFRLFVSELLDLYARLQIRSSWSEMD
ncbi:PTS lactose/cellobiose transporter subunit IIA [Allobaculum sp. Allo2]|nr:PTS lactose/cellobiose transporter subunit IIA [Allobaculum sp. Allo2]UNT94516.1 PTS lactose/cellobiose transporter subunit IIA [Allobaculum sp. Allo2]